MNPIPNIRIENILFDPYHSGKAWKSAFCWCMDSVPGVVAALVTASFLSAPVDLAAGAPPSVQWALIGGALGASYWVFRKCPKFSGRMFAFPPAYRAMRCEMIRVLIEADPDGGAAMVRVVLNNQMVWMPLEAARKSPWDSIRRMDRLDGQPATAPIPKKMQEMVAETICAWERDCKDNRRSFIGFAPIA